MPLVNVFNPSATSQQVAIEDENTLEVANENKKEDLSPGLIVAGEPSVNAPSVLEELEDGVTELANPQPWSPSVQAIGLQPSASYTTMFIQPQTFSKGGTSSGGSRGL